MERHDLARLVQRNEVAAVSLLASSAPATARRYGLSASTRAGVFCMSCADMPIALLHRAIGFGTQIPAERRALDAILRFYAKLALPARVELAEGIAPAAAERLLERTGFEREGEAHHVHVRDAEAAPSAPPVPELRISRVPRREAGAFGRLVRVGFEVDGGLGDLFERASAAILRTGPSDRVACFQGTLADAPAATGMLFISSRVGGLYSGSVLPDFRGRGIQSAMISERVRYGWERGLRIFTSQTEPDGASQHNLHDMGFRLVYRSAFFLRSP